MPLLWTTETKAETLVTTILTILLLGTHAFGNELQLKHIDCGDVLKTLDAPFAKYDDQPFEELRRMFHLGRRPHPELIMEIIDRIDRAPDAPPGTLGFNFYRSRRNFMKTLGVDDEEGAMEDLLRVRTFLSDPHHLPDEDILHFHIQTDGKVDEMTGVAHQLRTAIRLADIATVGLLKSFLDFELTIHFKPEKNLYRDSLRTLGTTVLNLVVGSETHPHRFDAARATLQLGNFYATGAENLLSKSSDTPPRYVLPERIGPTLMTIRDRYPSLSEPAQSILNRLPKAEGDLFE